MFHLSSQKNSLHHARYLQAFDLCASVNPGTTLSITGCGSSNGVKDSVWRTLIQASTQKMTRTLIEIIVLHY